jgi:outer membrane protein TolC
MAARASRRSNARGKWWEIFGDPELNQLEEQIAGSNQNLKVAEARFREAGNCEAR